MKYLMIAAALIGATMTASAFAQSNPSNNQTASAATMSQGGHWVPSYGQQVAGKTRAQVYQELVQAEQDGEMAQLNTTVYKGS